MRCKNCGANNSVHALKCIHCNVPLVGSMVVDMNISDPKISDGIICNNCKSINPPNATNCRQCKAQLANPRFSGSEKSSDQLEIKSESALPAPQQRKPRRNVCPVCSYPNQPISNECVKCHTPLLSVNPTVPKDEPSKEINTQKQPAPNKIPERKEPDQQADSLNMTINPWAQQPVIPDEFCLIPLKSDYSASGDPISLENAENNLNRDKLDPGNMTITSSSQAIVQQRGGKWLIRDTSSMQTTFVKVQGEMELRDGDIILMGNKIFKFSRKK
ncbi:MAG: hypothetical protein QY315_07825 [Saprospiraceae bacterium]|nr:MAG: hypothetical protein QY315_07825 [Saprospiraceae bacterium]